MIAFAVLLPCLHYILILFFNHWILTFWCTFIDIIIRQLLLILIHMLCLMQKNVSQLPICHWCFSAALLTRATPPNQLQQVLVSGKTCDRAPPRDGPGRPNMRSGGANIPVIGGLHPLLVQAPPQSPWAVPLPEAPAQGSPGVGVHHMTRQNPRPVFFPPNSPGTAVPSSVDGSESGAEPCTPDHHQ